MHKKSYLDDYYYDIIYTFFLLGFYIMKKYDLGLNPSQKFVPYTDL